MADDLILQGIPWDGKVCGKCGQIRPYTDFPKRKRRGGHDNYCRQCKGINKQAWDKENREWKKQYARMRTLQHYGLTVDMYDQMYEQQGGQCAICGQQEKDNNRERLCVDHNHQTGQVRGLLCVACNSYIGHINENIETLQVAMDYIKHWNSMGG